jgi:hypothetical protein
VRIKKQKLSKQINKENEQLSKLIRTTKTKIMVGHIKEHSKNSYQSISVIAIMRMPLSLYQK